MKHLAKVIIFSGILAIFLSGMAMAQNNLHSEKVFAHTDREVYVSGELLFFKLYIVDAATHQPSTISKTVYVVLRNTANRSITEMSFQAEHSVAYGSILLPDTLSSGIYQLVAFTHWMRNFGESSFFTKEIFVANALDRDLPVLNSLNERKILEQYSSANKLYHNDFITISCDKTNYGQREKVMLKLLYNPGDADTIANLSVSVSAFVPDNYPDSTFAVFFAAATSPSGKSNFNRSPTVGLPYVAETKTEVLQGKIKNIATGEPVKSCCVILSAVDSMVNLQYDYSRSDGSFCFPMNDYYNDKGLVLGIRGYQEEENLQLLPENKFELTSAFIPGKFYGNEDFKQYIKRSQDVVRICKTYDLQATAQERPLLKKKNFPPEIYFKPTIKIFPDDYQALNDLSEISKELLKTVKIHRQNESYFAILSDAVRHESFSEQPALFLDGVMIKDLDRIINLGSKEIQRVEVVNEPLYYGQEYFPGVLAVFSKGGMIDKIDPGLASVRLHLQPNTPFSNGLMPFPEGKIPDNLPDFRQMLYWNPSINSKENQETNIEFYTSRLTGIYMIKVEGITTGGKAVSATAKITVE